MHDDPTTEIPRRPPELDAWADEPDPEPGEIPPADLFAATDRLQQRAQRADDARRERAAPSTVDRGSAAEQRAAAFLAAKGLVIVETNYRCKVGELDIVARDGATLVFVEVRSRYSGRYGSGAEMVTPAKQKQVSRVAAAYVALRRPRERRFRFDVVALTGASVVHIPDAWRIGF